MDQTMNFESPLGSEYLQMFQRYEPMNELFETDGHALAMTSSGQTQSQNFPTSAPWALISENGPTKNLNMLNCETNSFKLQVPQTNAANNVSAGPSQSEPRRKKAKIGRSSSTENQPSKFINRNQEETNNVSNDLNNLSVSPLGPTISAGSIYPTFDCLMESLQTASKKYNFKVGRSTHAMRFDDAKRYFKIPHETPEEYERDRFCCLPKKGWFYCTKGGKSCPFRVHFLFDDGVLNYRIMECCENHNHLTVVNETVVRVNIESDLSQKERDFIIDVAPFVELDLLQKQLQIQYPNRQYDFSLLQTLRSRGNQIHRGQQDPDSLNKLMQFGKHIKEDGGLFEIKIDEFFRLTEIHIQTASMRQYAKQYGDFTQIEHVKDLPIKDYKYFIFKTVDCFNREVLTGISIIHWEHVKTLSKSLECFGLDRQRQSTLVTDCKPYFAQMTCSSHIYNPNSIKMLDQNIRKAFEHCELDLRSTFDQVLYNERLSVLQCDQLLQKIVHSLPEENKLLHQFIQNKHKICAAYKSRVFAPTASGEFRSSELISSNTDLFQLVQSYISRFERQEELIKTKIESILCSGSIMTSSVKDHIDSLTLSSTCKYICDRLPDFLSVNDIKYSCWNVFSDRHDVEGHGVHYVRIPIETDSDVPYPTCDCRTFMQLKLPCHAILKVMSLCDNQKISHQSVHPRWRLANHPLYIADSDISSLLIDLQR